MDENRLEGKVIEISLKIIIEEFETLSVKEILAAAKIQGQVELVDMKIVYKESVL